MKNSVDVKWGNLRVGILLTFAIVMLFWASLTGGGTSIFDTKIKYTAYFTNVNGLLNGSPVWMSGVEVGNVQSVKFVNLDEKRKVEVIFKYEDIEDENGDIFDISFKIIGLVKRESLEDHLQYGVGYVNDSDMMTDAMGMNIHTVLEGEDQLRDFYEAWDGETTGSTIVEIIE